MKPYQKSVEEVIESLQSNAQHGLSQVEVANRLKKMGPNAIPEEEKKSLFFVFLEQFKSPLIYLLLCAAAIIFFMGESRLDAFIISGVLFFNAILGTIQERRTSRIIETLNRFLKTASVVVRDGVKKLVPDEELVEGDIILVQEGQRVSADARIIENVELYVDEAVLTGESAAIKKESGLLSQERGIGDQKNMLFKGTFILSGSARAIITATGIRTEMGAIRRSMEGVSTDFPLKKEMDRLSYAILLFIFGVCGFLFVIGLVGGQPLGKLLVMLTALFICVVPEGLPVALTLVLVTGAYRMAKQNVLVKNLQAVESLGRADVIMLDKTGTLTRNEMVVTKVYAHKKFWQVSGLGYHARGEICAEDSGQHGESDESIVSLALAANLLNNAEISYQEELDTFTIVGDPTEAALFVFSQKVPKVNKKQWTLGRKLHEIPFGQVGHFHAVLYAEYDRPHSDALLLIAGAPEELAISFKNYDEVDKNGLEQLLQRGLRVIAVAQKRVSSFEIAQYETEFQNHSDLLSHLIKKDLDFIGFCGIEDAIRTEVITMVDKARKAGLFVVMATGDHQKTALHVARKVGIYTDQDYVIDGSQIDTLSDEDLLKNIMKTTVYSRVSSLHKMRIVRLFHTIGHIVAMTGDGINDAPSLLAADLGIAMGKIGTEVAKQAADLVLLDDSFESIIHAVEEGRHIFYTLKRVVLYFFATNLGEILIVLFALVYSIFYEHALPLPLTAGQILWLNLVTDGFLDVSLSMEPKEEGLLDKKWLQNKTHLIDKDLCVQTLFMAVIMGIGSLLVFLSWYRINLAKAQTMTLVVMALFQWFNAWNCRSLRFSVFQIGLFKNRWFLAAAVFVFGLQLAIVYHPSMQYIFKTVPLSLYDWVVIIPIAATLFFIDELRKFFAQVNKIQ